MRMFLPLSRCLVTSRCAPPGRARSRSPSRRPRRGNFASLETTVACGGATTPEARARAEEDGIQVDHQPAPPDRGRGQRRRRSSGREGRRNQLLQHPLQRPSARPEGRGRFLDAITAPGNEPAYIHCAAGNRAGAMWMIKRLAVDHWETERAVHRSRRARPDQPGAETVRDRLRARRTSADPVGAWTN